MPTGVAVPHFSASFRCTKGCAIRRNSSFRCLCYPTVCWDGTEKSENLRRAVLLQNGSGSKWHWKWLWWTFRRWVSCSWIANIIANLFCFLLFYLQLSDSFDIIFRFFSHAVVKKLAGQRNKKKNCDNFIWKIKTIHQLNKVRNRREKAGEIYSILNWILYMKHIMAHNIVSNRISTGMGHTKCLCRFDKWYIWIDRNREREKNMQY